MLPSAYAVLRVKLMWLHLRPQASETFIVLFEIINAICRSGYPIMRNIAFASRSENGWGALRAIGGKRTSVVGLSPDNIRSFLA
jgi:hypothetical protein